MSKKLSETVREAIEEKIAVGIYPPGYHLDEVELGNTFGVSRTPIREALSQLASIGVVKMRPRLGAVVAEISPLQLVEMFEVMAELEALCGRLAARRMTPAAQAKLRQAHEACKQADSSGDADAYYYCNEVFHHQIYAGSSNQFLTEQASLLHRRLRPYRRLQLHVRGRMGQSFNEHHEVMEAIFAGDGERAAERLRQHVIIQGERFTDLVANLRTLNADARGGAAPPANSQQLPGNVAEGRDFVSGPA